MADSERRVLLLAPFKESARRILSGLTGTTVIHGPRIPDASQEDELFAAASSAITQHRCTHVVATSESNLALAGRLRDRHLLPGPDWIQSLAVTDKRCMRLWTSKVVPMAAAWPASEIANNPDLLDGVDEVVVKPVACSSSRGVARVPASTARDHLVHRTDLVYVEQALDVDVELHCDGYLTAGLDSIMVVSMYDRPVLRARGTTRASIHLPEDHHWTVRARAMATAVLSEAPVVQGVFHIEMLLVGDQLFLGEIALRPAGGGVAESLLRHRGLDLWDTFVRVQVGLAPRPQQLSAVSAAHAWQGVVGVVSECHLGDEHTTEHLRRQPGVVSIRWLDNRPLEAATSSCAFTWHVFFAVETATEARELIQRSSAIAAAAASTR